MNLRIKRDTISPGNREKVKKIHEQTDFLFTNSIFDKYIFNGICIVVQPPAEEPQKQVEENTTETPVTPAYEEPKAEEPSEEAKTSPKTNQNPIQSETEENTGDKSPNADTPRSGTPHDESDYDDNITVTVPKPQTLSNNYHDYRDRLHMNGRYNRSMSSSIPNQDSESSLSQPPHQVCNVIVVVFFFSIVLISPNVWSLILSGNFTVRKQGTIWKT